MANKKISELPVLGSPTSAAIIPVVQDGDTQQVTVAAIVAPIVATLVSATLDSLTTTVSTHVANTSNPHATTKAQVGLGNADNTSDANKPVSTATQNALNLKADATSLTSHTSNTSNPHSVTAAQVGLGNVNNTSDANKPISTATQTALDLKASTSDLTSHTSNTSNPHGVTKSQVGLGNVDNTSDVNKPISTATQSALNDKVNSNLLGAVSGVATLNGSGVLSTSQVPATQAISTINGGATLALNGTVINLTGAVDVIGSFTVNGDEVGGGTGGTTIFVIAPDANPAFLTTDGGAPTGSNQIVLSNYEVITFSALVNARTQGISTDAFAAWKIEGVIRRENNAASTELFGLSTSTFYNNYGWTLSVIADTSLGALVFRIEGEPAEAVRASANVIMNRNVY
jgi:hypothetical protein